MQFKNNKYSSQTMSADEMVTTHIIKVTTHIVKVLPFQCFKHDHLEYHIIIIAQAGKMMRPTVALMDRYCN